MRWLIPFALLCAVGCSKPGVEPRVEIDPSVTMWDVQVKHAMTADGSAGPVILADERYVLPSQEWVDWCIAAYRRHMRAMNLVLWMVPRDCDNHARRFASFMQEKYAQQWRKGWPDGVAVFTRFFRQKEGGGHAINVICLDDYTVHDYEPQNPGGWLNLTPQERASSWYVGD